MKPSTRRVLAALRTGPQTTHSLCQPDVGGLRFGARLLELRAAGIEVSEERLPLPTRGSLYRLLSEPEVEQASGEAKGPPDATQTSPGPVPSSEGVRLAAPAESHGGLFDAGAFHHSSGFGDAA